MESQAGMTTEKNPQARKLLPCCVGWHELKLHGKFRRYQVDVAKGDSLTHYSLGDVESDGEAGSTQLPLPEGVVRDGIEYPTFWSRLPLSIQPNNRDQRRGLYSIHAMGTSLIFPLSQKNLEVRQENNMRCCTAGIYLALETDSPTITFHFRYLNRSNPAQDGRPALKGLDNRSFSGIDIYQLEDGVPVFKKNLRSPAGVMEGSWCYETGLLEGVASGRFVVMLPTYNGFQPLEKLEKSEGEIFESRKNPSGFTLEFSPSSTTTEFEPFAESSRKPILIYGTSITQGDGDNGLRPGATYAAQIMWATQREVINLGVAGSAQLEYKMADFLAQIESEVFILDPGWNLTATSFDAVSCTANGAPASISNDEVVARIKYMVQVYRQHHPATPIVICPKFLKEGDGDANGGKSAVPPKTISLPADWKNSEGYLYSREGFLLLKAYLELVAAGVENLHWAEQGVTEENGNWLGQGLTAAHLHPPVGGMTSIANFVLQAVAQAAPQIYDGKKLSIPVD